MNSYRIFPYLDGELKVNHPIYLNLIEALSLKEALHQVSLLHEKWSFLDGIDITPIKGPRHRKIYKFNIYHRCQYIGDWECKAFDLHTAFLNVWEVYNRDLFKCSVSHINGKSTSPYPS